MNWAHVHLLLNHVPIVGSAFAFLLLGIGFSKNSDEWKKVSFMFFLLFALIAIPVYLTGEPAEKVIKNLPGVSIPLVDNHEDAALISLVGIEILGFLGLVGLYLYQHTKAIPRWLGLVILLLSLVTAASMIWTGNLGGKIHHPEIRSNFTSATSPEPAPIEPPGKIGE